MGLVKAQDLRSVAIFSIFRHKLNMYDRTIPSFIDLGTKAFKK
jgi:hypothetical protein